MSEPDEAVQVAVRMRPFSQREIDADARLVVRMQKDERGSRTWIRKPDGTEREYQFDHSFQTFSPELAGQIGEYADQDYVFERLGRPAMKEALEGKNVCLFAYGQTGAGKSYSMLGKERSSDASLQGIIPRICNEIFRRRDEEKDNPLVETQIYIQVVEIYCEQINDLLSPRRVWPAHGHKPRFLGHSLGYTVDTIRHHCQNYADIQQAIDQAAANRSIGAHALNGDSSRAHTLYIITYKRTERKSATAKEATTLSSTINLVDLAGSERCDKAETHGRRSQHGGDMMKEGIHVNKSLSALGNCIQVLSQNKKDSLVPFNNSRLTLLLQGAMTNGRVIMIAALSPASICYDESVSTLEFAKRIKRVRIRVTKNICTDPIALLREQKAAMEKQMQEEIDRLRDALKAAGGDPDAFLEHAKAGSVREQELQAELQAERQRREEMEATLERYMAEEEQRVLQTPQQRAQLHAEETHRAQRELTQELERDGIRNSAPPPGPHLQNINEDPRLSGMITFPLRRGVNNIGLKSRGSDTHVVLHGEGIFEGHCKITLQGEEALLHDVLPGARVLINGLPFTPRPGEKHLLLHNTRIWFGVSRGNIFVMQDPSHRDQPEWCEPGIGEDGVSFQMAMHEADRLHTLQAEMERAAATGDHPRAAALKKQMESFTLEPASPREGQPSLADLERMKAQAIQEEDYEEAGRLNRLIKEAKGQLSHRDSDQPSLEDLERQKRRAIEIEDYGEAQRLTDLIRARKGQPRGQFAGPRTYTDPASDMPTHRRASADEPDPLHRGGSGVLMRGDSQHGYFGYQRGGPPTSRADLIPMTARSREALKQRVMYVGKASVSLDFLVDPGKTPSSFMTLPLELGAGAVGSPEDGDPPQLCVNIYQMQTPGVPLKRFTLGERADFVVHVIGAKGIPALYSQTTLCKYVFKWGERDSYKTGELKNTTEPNFDFKKRFAFPKMTQTLMDWFRQPGVLTFEVIGIGMLR
eukprot:TRINITY_DN60201_c0_g1_i1.p1 TRINITY_DN60201_c0_g1~~TRINITY_DN60201_c0_g1_i1.p1  ORF type:complete len:1013 (+),score=311.97 TRINITY_DN60201_c0_g1_i1:96-3041(+)